MKSYIFIITGLIIVNFVINSSARRDFYKILGVSKTASDQEIKKNFRKLAVDSHPDKNLDDKDATKKFQDLREAFEVLSNKEKRRLYDEGGEERLKKSSSMGSYFEKENDFNFADFAININFGNNDEERETPRGSDVIYDLWASYEELYLGRVVQLNRIKPVYKTTTGTRKCNCKHKMIQKKVGPNGIYVIPTTECDQCPNMELTTQEKILEVEIEPGMEDGSMQRFHGEGEPHIDGETGDLIVRVRTMPHSFFERRGNDLYANATITLAEALSGFSLFLKHLDGRTVVINHEKITWPGAKIKKLGEGMPNFTNNKMRGALFVTFDIDFPRGELTSEDKEAIKNILAKYSSSKYSPSG